MPLNMDWMRQNQVNILKYLPEFLAKDKDFKAVADTCSEEHDLIRLELQDIFQQFFVTTATWGLSYWEAILDVTPDATDGYTKRRRRILLRLQSSQTSTVAYMITLAKRYFASNANVEIKEDNANYAFRIIADAVSFDITGLIEAINTYKPAHLALIIVHSLTGTGSFYLGAYMQTYKCITINPAVTFTFDTNNTEIYAAGVIQTAGTIEI
jgi:hypothetical protein